jgi:DNA-binding MarR family transcriptional regulator
MARRGKEGSWTLLTSHGHVLVEIARNAEATIRELAVAAGITERSTAMIVADLVDAGYVLRERVGRRNRYEVRLDRGFRHASQRDLRVGPFLDLLTAGRLPKPGTLHLTGETLS